MSLRDYDLTMQIHPDAALASDTSATPPLPESRTFRVVYAKGGLNGSLWKVDVVTDTAIDAARCVAYAEELPAEFVVGVLDLATLR